MTTKRATQHHKVKSNQSHDFDFVQDWQKSSHDFDLTFLIFFDIYKGPKRPEMCKILIKKSLGI
jgi:hypothetical protein